MGFEGLNDVFTFGFTGIICGSARGVGALMIVGGRGLKHLYRWIRDVTDGVNYISRASLSPGMILHAS